MGRLEAYRREGQRTMSRKVSVIIKRPGGKPYKTNISVSIKNLQNTVGGNINIVRMREDMAFIVNEEGHLLGLPHNFTVYGVELYGTVIVIGIEGERFDDIPITFDQAKKLFPQMWEAGRS